MSLQLRDDLAWCISQGRAVFLDTVADRYFTLAGKANEAFLRLASGEAQRSDVEQLHALMERGMLREDGLQQGFRLPPKLAPPTHDVTVATSGFAHPLRLIRALLLERAVAAALRRGQFHALLQDLRQAGVARPSRNVDERRQMERIVAAFATAAFLTGSHDRCLVRAIAAQWASTGKGLRSKLVFGVIAHPFAAHCWVQLGAAVMVGGYEEARLYTPILVIE